MFFIAKSGAIARLTPIVQIGLFLFLHIAYRPAFTEELAGIQCEALMVLNLKPIV